MSPSSTNHLTSKLAQAALALVLKARTGALALLLVIGAAAFLWSVWSLLEIERTNNVITAIRGGDDIAVDPKRAHSELVLARLRQLLNQGRNEEAQILVDGSRAGPMAETQSQARLLYTLGNARVRAAIARIEKGELDKAIPEVRLAKESYREALRLDPAGWDAKHNYDVAMRLVRDLPGVEQESEDVPPDAPKRLWTDLPGVPRGLP
ncbi:MAG: hypothetical protein WC807_11365 [Hyphomicrobium sp.]|jgi:mxaK protein